MALQTTFGSTLARGVAGMLRNMEKSNVISRVAEGAIGFGKVVIQGASDNTIKAMAAGVFDAASAAKAGNTGNGALTLGTPKTAAGVKPGGYVVTIIEPASNGGVFSVTDPDGNALATGTIGVLYDGVVRFTIADGATDFVAGDQFTITVDQTGNTVIRGISLKNEVQPAAVSNPDQYVATDIVPVVTKGVVVVVNGSGGAVAAGDPAFVTSAGAITNVGTGGNIRIPGAMFDSSGANGALVDLRVDM